MADASYQTAPKLTQTTAKDAAYAPVSWLAVAAAGISVVFLVILVILGGSAFFKRQHLLAYEMLILPAFGLALAFAGYQHVKNSEGTRTGHLFKLNLITFSVAACLLGGAGYFAYMQGVEFSVRADAENEFLGWAANFKALDPNDLSRKDFAPIVHKTLEPGAQQNISATDFAALQLAFPEQSLQAVQSDVARIALRNPGKIEFKPQGLVNWEREKDRIQCLMNAELISPEGVHSIQFRMYAIITSKGQRVWAIENKPIYSNQRRLTEYGQKIEELEYAGMIFSQRWLNQIDASNRVGEPEQREIVRYSAFTDYMARPLQPNTIQPMFFRQVAVSLAGGVVSAALQPSNDYARKLAADFFTPLLPATGLAPDDRSKKETELRSSFLSLWNQGKIARAGFKISQTKDVFPVLTYDDRAITVTAPLELLLNQSDTARGRVRVECLDAKMIAELKRLRAAAIPESAQPSGPPRMDPPTTAWRVVEIRSDFKPVASAKPDMQASMPGM
jgi:hypothetical protein